MLLYLPPNAPSKIQPCDAGLVQNFKAYYRHRFNSLLLDWFEKKIDEHGKTTVLEGIRLAIQACTSDVSPETIINCLYRCKLCYE